MSQHPSWKVVQEKFTIGGKEVTLETGKIAKQADGAVLVSCNDTRVLVTAVSAHEAKPGQDFFPLTVEYQEKYYASGKIPGGFFKREAKPSTDATLTARLTDRPLRPLFPSGYMFDTQIVATVLSTDQTIEPGILAGIAASAALHISDIPFSGPIACCQVAMVKGKLVANPTHAELEEAKLEMIISGSKNAVLMVEGGAKFVSEEEMLDAIKFGHEAVQPAIAGQEKLRKAVGKEKREFVPDAGDVGFKKEVEAFLTPKIKAALNVREKLKRYEGFDGAKKEAAEKFLSAITDDKE